MIDIKKRIKAVYDYSKIDPDCLERYTVVFKDQVTPGTFWGLGLSEHGYGVSLWLELDHANIGKHLGKRVSFDSLNKTLQNHIIGRYTEATKEVTLNEP